MATFLIGWGIFLVLFFIAWYALISRSEKCPQCHGDEHLKLKDANLLYCTYSCTYCGIDFEV